MFQHSKQRQKVRLGVIFHPYHLLRSNLSKSIDFITTFFQDIEPKVIHGHGDLFTEVAVEGEVVLIQISLVNLPPLNVHPPRIKALRAYENPWVSLDKALLNPCKPEGGYVGGVG